MENLGDQFVISQIVNLMLLRMDFAIVMVLKRVESDPNSYLH